MMKNPHARGFGNWGEKTAAEYYSRLGFEVIARNVRTPYGEIDLIVKDAGGLVFVEVKTRSNLEFGFPEDSITGKKQEHMVNSANAYLQEHPEFEAHWTIDVLSIQRLKGSKEIRIERFENAIQ